MTLSAGITGRLERLRDRHEELAALLADADVIGNRERYAVLSREYASIAPVVACHRDCKALAAALADARALQADPDPELRELADEDVRRLAAELARREAELRVLLLPRDPDDSANVFLEIRAGTGGDEAALFAGDLLRMYQRYASAAGFALEVVSAREGELGGYREVITRIEGAAVYARLKFESGTHRVQRIPATEANGRIHTSACTVAVLPEGEAIDDVVVNKDDLRVDTFRASGAGGQHVNRTESAVRFTHLPTGIVVECQDERSQHKNRARALSLLKARLLDRARSEQASKQAAQRKLQVGSGDRSERIRTYNFPQGRITDHRINLTVHALREVLEGDLDQLIEPLRTEHQAEQLAELGEAVPA
jgi:peptide chain release factor 1